MKDKNSKQESAQAQAEPAPGHEEGQAPAVEPEPARRESGAVEGAATTPASAHPAEARAGMPAAAAKFWRRLHLSEGSKPAIGALAIAGSALALAAEIGAAEVLLGAVAGYAAYRMLRYGVPLTKALSEGIALGNGGPSKAAAAT